MTLRTILVLAFTLSFCACDGGGGDSPASDSGVLGVTLQCPTVAQPAYATVMSFEATGGTPSYRFTCSLDGNPVACTSGGVLPPLHVGEHTFLVTVTDSSTNADAAVSDMSATSAPCTFDVSAVGPTVVGELVSSHAGAIRASGEVHFGVSGNLPHLRFDCTVNGTTTTGCTSPIMWNGLTNGATLNVSIVAIDLDTGGMSAPLQLSGMVDLEGPSLTIQQPTEGFLFGVLDAIPVDFDSDGEAAMCDVDGTNFDCSAAVAEDIGSLANGDGSHTVTVVSSDALENTTTKTVSFSVDAKGPDVLTVTAPSGSVCPTSTAELPISASDAAPYQATTLSFVCFIDGVQVACASTSGTTLSLGWSGLTEASHTVRVVAYDRFSNPGPTNPDDSVGTTATIMVSSSGCP